MAFHDWLAHWSAWFWHLIANHLWQSTLFALLIFLALALLKHSPARARYAIWLIALAKFALPAALFIILFYKIGFDFSGLLSPHPASETAITQVAEPMPYLYTETFNDVVETQKHNEIYCGLTIVWFIGFIGLLGYWIGQRRNFAFAVNAGERVSQGKEAASLRRVKSWLLIKREVGLMVSPKIAEPGVWGTFRPIIVLPETMSETLTEEELDAVMMHEMIHLARWDNLVSNVQMFFCCLFWFHPLVWFIDKRLLVERESACDETVIELGGAHGIYAASLLKVLKFCLGLRVAGVSAASGSNLKRRIEKIMAHETHSRLALSHRALVLVVAAAVILFSLAAGILSRTQVVAQNRKTNAPVGGVSGGVPGGVPGGVAGGVAGGIPDGIPGGIADGIPGGVAGEVQGENYQKTQEVLKELENAPETALQYKNKQGVPLTITDASMKAVPNYATFRKQGESWTPADKVYAVKYTIKLTNNTNRAIKGVALDFRNEGDDHEMYFENLKPLIEPYATYTLTPRRFYNLAGEPAAIIARVVGVLFADGEGWGKVPPPPPPPPPPSPATPPSAETLPAPPDAPLPPEESKVIRKSGGVLQGAALHRVNPEYPDEAKAARVTGVVTVEIKIDEQGKVIGARVLSGHPLLRDAAVEAARQWMFQPTYLQGEPVKVIGTVTFNFTL